MIAHRGFIPAVFVCLGLVCAAVLIVSSALFLRPGSASAGVSARGTMGVTAGVNDPPWTSVPNDPPWT
jgi:hypothetical protein